MEVLYSSIEIDKILEDSKEVIKYYIVTDVTFGIKITKSSNYDKVEKNVLSINNILNEEKDAKELIDIVINCGMDLSQIKYVIEDYVKAKVSIDIA